jgi:hypothetical protein
MNKRSALFLAAWIGAAPFLKAEMAKSNIEQLGSLIQFSIPAIPEPPISASAWDSQKATLLLEQASLANTASIASSALAPKKVLATINSILKDVPAEKLQKLTQPQANAVAGLILDRLFDRQKPAAQTLDAVAVLSQLQAEQILDLREQPLRTITHYEGSRNNHEDQVAVHGVPSSVKLIRSQTVFRHYTTKEGLDEILRTQSLKNGFLPYIQRADGLYRKTFEDLNGIFLTLPGKNGKRVGVPKSEYPHYVDLILPARLPVLEIESNGIYMIPLPARTRNWISRLYNQWVDGKNLANHDLSTVETVNQKGGLGPELAVPVKIVGHGKAR